MADEFDVEAMLEEQLNYKDEKSDNNNGERHNGDGSSSKSKKHKRSRSRSRERRHDRKDRDKDRRSREGRRKSRSGSRDRRHSDGKDRDRQTDKDRDRRRRSRSQSYEDRFKYHGRFSKYGRRRSPGKFGGKRRSLSRSPVREGTTQIGRRERPSFGSETADRIERRPTRFMTPEERDARTVFCFQLSNRLRPRDLEEFFSSVGKVNDARLITDSKTGRSKGIAYVEFEEPDSVQLALNLTGQRLLGVPIQIQQTQAEKNRAQQQTNPLASITGMDPLEQTTGPMRLYVGSLHFNITEEMLRGIFEPFGRVDDVTLMKDKDTGRSKGFGFITFHLAEDAKRALEQLNGFELAGRPMRVGHVTDKTENGAMFGGSLDIDEMDRSGIDLGPTGRLQLMAKLAQNSGLQVPAAAQNMLNPSPMVNSGPFGFGATAAGGAPRTTDENATPVPPISTACFMLSNVVSSNQDVGPAWEQSIKDDIVEECAKHGGCVHFFIDKSAQQGSVYVKCTSVQAAIASVSALHGRWIGGKMITAAYVPEANYHQLFPDAVRLSQPLRSSR